MIKKFLICKDKERANSTFQKVTLSEDYFLSFEYIVLLLQIYWVYFFKAVHVWYHFSNRAWTEPSLEIKVNRTKARTRRK